MKDVRAKKHLGQHFLIDQTIAERTANALFPPGSLVALPNSGNKLLEIGPGMGILTKYLLHRADFDVHAIELDQESIEYLKKSKLLPENKLIEGDFLKLDFDAFSDQPFSIVGNFPYNISNMIMFRVFENRDKIAQISGMFQHEVAERITSKPGKKAYGILSVFLQAFYTAEYLFVVGPEVFNPPPKVKSAIIRLVRNNVKALNCDEKLFITVVKTAFNQRRKMLSNSLKSMLGEHKIASEIMNKRPEQLSVAEFEMLTNTIEKLSQNQ